MHIIIFPEKLCSILKWCTFTNAGAQKGKTKTVSEWNGMNETSRIMHVLKVSGKQQKRKRFSLLYIRIRVQVIHFNTCEWERTECELWRITCVSEWVFWNNFVFANCCYNYFCCFRSLAPNKEKKEEDLMEFLSITF